MRFDIRGSVVGMLTSLVVISALLAGCASSAAFRLGDEAAVGGDWDTAVEHYRAALQENPNDARARIALERAMQSAARAHAERAQELQEEGELPAALTEYRQASELDPTNGRLMAIVASLERQIRDLIESSQPPSALEEMQARARQASQPPLLDPSSDELLSLQFRQAQLRDILGAIGNMTGINVTFDQAFQDRTYSVQLDGVTVDEALDQILTATLNFYKVLNPRSLIVIPDNANKRAQYEEQVIRTFFVSNADVTELATMLTLVARAGALAVQATIVANPTANTITARATVALMGVIERLIAANDKPRAEIVVDVEILEVNRERAREFGLDLTSYSVGALFSPSSTSSGAGSPNTPASSGFNANLLSQGISAADFYLAVPAAVVNFLETDSETRLIASPQLRGQEGAELTLHLGDDIPVPSTSFTAIATGGVAVNPLTSFEYRAVGVRLNMTPRVTYDNEIILDLEVENSTLGPNINVAGQALPTFGTRLVITRLRLRDGESNLLAGLLREEDRRSLRGFPGILHLPVIKQLLSANEDSIKQTDIIMLLTPRIVRTHQLTQRDVDPIFIGTANNFGVTGPPPLIAPTPAAPPAPADGPQADAGLDGTGPGDTGDPSRFGTAPVLSSTPEFPTERHPRPMVPPGTTRPTFGAVVEVIPPAAGVAVGSGPYEVPISISGVSQLSTLSLRLTYDPRVLRVNGVQEGSFMSQGRAEVTFAHEVDASRGHIDLALTRTGDTTGASGAGLVAAVVFEPVAQGATTLAPTGVGLTPGGAPLAFSFRPTTVSVR